MTALEEAVLFLLRNIDQPVAESFKRLRAGHYQEMIEAEAADRALIVNGEYGPMQTPYYDVKAIIQHSIKSGA